MRFGDKLDRLISERGTNQVEVGAVLGVHQTRVSQLTKGKGEVSRTQLIKLARFFGVSADWLGDDDQDDPPAGFSPAEQQAIKMVRNLHLDEGEVIRRLSTPPIPPVPFEDLIRPRKPVDIEDGSSSTPRGRKNRPAG